jgi:2-dehydro-3-deoxygluconokinase
MPATDSPPTVVTFGELMLSLTPPGYERLVQAESFTARYTGAEANVAVSLAHFGMEAYAVSKVPEHEIGQAAINYLRQYGVRTDFIVRGGSRLGLLYLETGAGQRPSKVIYDRAPSSIREVRPEEFDWPAILAGKQWFHFSGTAPALGDNVRRVLTDGLQHAKRLGLTVSCDCNYRSKLWGIEEAGRVLTSLLEYIDVLVCGKEDAEKLFGVAAALEADAADEMRRRFNLDSVAMTLRQGISASVNRWSALLCRTDGICRGREYEIEIVDRIGAGDSFTAGLIYGILSGYPSQRIVDFAVAASCLKHSIPGDFNLVSRDEVEQLLAGDQSGRVQR